MQLSAFKIFREYAKNTRHEKQYGLHTSLNCKWNKCLNKCLGINEGRCDLFKLTNINPKNSSRIQIISNNFWTLMEMSHKTVGQQPNSQGPHRSSLPWASPRGVGWRLSSWCTSGTSPGCRACCTPGTSPCSAGG